MGGSEELAAWHAGGFRAFTVPASGEQVAVSWDFVEQTRHLVDMPTLAHRVTVIHGAEDEVVPPSFSQQFCAQCSQAKLVLVQDDHALTAVETLEQLAIEAVELFDLES